MEKIVNPSLFHDRNVEQKPKSTFKRQNGFIIVLSIILLLVTVFFVPIQMERPFAYHEKKLKSLLENYIARNLQYKDYTVYPLYDEYDKLSYFLVDFEPEGYLYLQLNKKTSLINRWTLSSFYSATLYPNNIWQRYTIEEGLETTIKDIYGYEHVYKHRRWEVDDDGNYILYKDSHFKVAGIREEKRYWLSLKLPKKIGGVQGYVPAVKRNGKYINLISMEEMDYTPGVSAAYPITDDKFYEGHYNLY